MQFKNVVIQSLAAIAAPIRLTSAQIAERLRPAMERDNLTVVTHALVQEIGGTISVQSRPGQETCFDISIPLVRHRASS